MLLYACCRVLLNRKETPYILAPPSKYSNYASEKLEEIEVLISKLYLIIYKNIEDPGSGQFSRWDFPIVS